MPRARYGTIQRAAGCLRARITVSTTVGAKRVWFNLNPSLSDAEARLYARKINDRTCGTVFDEAGLMRLRGKVQDGAIRAPISVDQPLVPGTREIVAPSTGGVYVIQASGYYVKIGRAENIARRLRHIQVNHPVPVRLLAVASTDPNDERSIHERLKSSRVRGEWFRLDEAVAQFIREVTP